MSSRSRLLLIEDEREKLDRLIGSAMLDSETYNRLVVERDAALFEEFALSPVSRHFISGLQTVSLAEIADAIVLYEKLLESSKMVVLKGKTID